MCAPVYLLATTDWDCRIHEAVIELDPVLSNRIITRCHYELSLALRRALGGPAGANFHTWAVWGSRKAGVTIRQEDLARAGFWGMVLSAALGGLLALAGVSLAVALGCGVVGLLACQAILARGRRIAPRLILHGNRIVLEDIGAATGRFLDCLHGPQSEEADRVARFLQSLRPGRTGAGGQDLLRAAFALYYQARCATDSHLKAEAAYRANCLAILHEHIRLQPCIEGAIPRGLRRLVTRWLLFFDVGPLRLRVSEDVATLDTEVLSQRFAALENEDAAVFLTGTASAPVEPGRAARDWTRLDQRMRYVLGLFHALHQSPAVFAAP